MVLFLLFENCVQWKFPNLHLKWKPINSVESAVLGERSCSFVLQSVTYLPNFNEKLQIAWAKSLIFRVYFYGRISGGCEYIARVFRNMRSTFIAYQCRIKHNYLGIFFCIFVCNDFWDCCLVTLVRKIFCATVWRLLCVLDTNMSHSF